MKRLYILVEGATEETFAGEVLHPFLLGRGIHLSARRIGKPGQKGGRVDYSRAKKDVLLLLKQDTHAHCTTLFDYYGLGLGFATAPPNANCEQKGRSVEEPFSIDVIREMGHTFRPERFIPYVQVHEFEALLFSDPAALAAEVGRPDLQSDFEGIVASFEGPEDIDDGTRTAPSKRIKTLVPNYDKVIHGNLAAKKIGLPRIRQKCQRFDAWIRRLESLGS